MRTIYVNEEQIRVDDVVVNQMMKDYPKIVYFVSPKGFISKYNILDLERSFNEGHHYLAYLKFAEDLVEEKDDPLSFEVVPLLQEMDLLIQKIPVDDQLNKKERIERYISNEIRALLL